MSGSIDPLEKWRERTIREWILRRTGG